jgi:Subtilase family
MPPMAYLLSFAVLLALAGTALGQAKKPPLPPGRDPGGVAVALLVTRFDYTAPHIAQRLARDGEGELIGSDLIDNDNRPFGDSRAETPAPWGGDGTIVASKIVDAPNGARLVPVRIDPRDPASLARAVAFIARTPARIVAVPMWGPRQEDWQPFRQAVERSPQLLFVVAAGDDGKDLDKDPVYPAAFLLPNVLVVTGASGTVLIGSSPRLQASANWGANTVDAVALAENSALATALAAKAAAAALSASPGLGGADLKMRLIEHALYRREVETPPRTRSPAILVPTALKVQTVPDPAARVLDKTRVPERLEEPIQRGKTR